MTRKEENAEMINKIDTTFTGTKDEGMMFLFSIISSCMLDVSKSLAIIADDKEPDDKETLDYYTTRCTSCGKVAPVGDYCIWCGEKGTCLEGGEKE